MKQILREEVSMFLLYTEKIGCQGPSRGTRCDTQEVSDGVGENDIDAATGPDERKNVAWHSPLDGPSPNRTPCRMLSVSLFGSTG